jgi:hypothetical protein
MNSGSVIGFLIVAVLAIGLHIASAVLYYRSSDQSNRDCDQATEWCSLAIVFDVLSYICAFGAVNIYVKAFFQ